MLTRAATAVLLVAGPASVAHAAPQYHLVPSVSASEVFDDNLFGAPDGGATVVTGPAPDPATPPPTDRIERESDFLSRVTPGVRAGIDTGAFHLQGGYRFNATHYAENSQLDSTQHGQTGDIGSSWQLTPRLSSSLSGGYRQSQSARDLNSGFNPLFDDANPQLATGVETRRGRARSWSVGPTFRYELSPLSGAQAGYRYTGSDQVGGTINHTHGAHAGIDRRLTPLDTVNLRYNVNGFDFGGFTDPNTPTGDDPGGVLSHSVTAGWARQLDPSTSLQLQAGPRITGGSVRSADAHASLRRSFANGAADIGYARTLGSIIGAPGTFDTDRAWIGGAYLFLQTVPTWGRFNWFRNSGGSFDSNSYLLELGVGQALTQWLQVQLRYDFRFQDQGFFRGSSVSGGGDEVYRNVVQLAFVASYPIGQVPASRQYPYLPAVLADVLSQG